MMVVSVSVPLPLTWPGGVVAVPTKYLHITQHKVPGDWGERSPRNVNELHIYGRSFSVCRLHDAGH